MEHFAISFSSVQLLNIHCDFAHLSDVKDNNNFFFGENVQNFDRTPSARPNNNIKRHILIGGRLKNIKTESKQKVSVSDEARTKFNDHVNNDGVRTLRVFTIF